jgi:CheY-like chemotaxis protein
MPDRIAHPFQKPHLGQVALALPYHLGDRSAFATFIQPRRLVMSERSASMFGSTEPSNGCVLVVEDDPGVRSGIRQALQGAGYEVIEAENAQKGMEAINFGEHPLVVDTVIADIDMEKGIDAVNYFKQQYPHVPLIVLTGLPERLRDVPDRMQVAIFGAGRGGYVLLEMLTHLPEVEVVAILDRDPFAPALARAHELGIPTFEADDARAIARRKDLQLIMDVTGDPKMERLLAETKRPETEVLGGAAAKLLWNLVQYEAQMQTQLIQSRKIASLLKDGITDYLVKPINRAKLLDAVETAVEHHEINRL